MMNIHTFCKENLLSPPLARFSIKEGCLAFLNHDTMLLISSKAISESESWPLFPKPLIIHFLSLPVEACSYKDLVKNPSCQALSG